MAGVIRGAAGSCAFALLAAGFASGAENPAPGEESQIYQWIREVRADIGSARSAIENRVLNAEARQAERIGAVHQRVDALEITASETRSPSWLHPLGITGSNIFEILAFIGVALGVWIAFRRYFARGEKKRSNRYIEPETRKVEAQLAERQQRAHEQELSNQYIELETRKLEAQLRERQLRAQEKEERWTHISFLFALSQRLLEDRELAQLLDILERPSRQAHLRNMLRKSGMAELNDEEARLLRALNRLLDHLELVAMAWNDALFTLQEVGVFLRRVAALTGGASLPELTSYCAQHHPLTHGLAKACHEFEAQGNQDLAPE